MARIGSHGPQLESLYESLLKAEPTNSALLYLRGRLFDDHKLAADYFARSEQADPQNPYPIHALAFDDIAAARWQEAKTRLDRVIQSDPEDRQFRSEWATACVATGQFDAAEKEFRTLLQRDPTDWQSVIELCQVFAAEGKRAEADQLVTSLDRVIRAGHPEAADQIQFITQCRLLYAFGDFAALEEEARKHVSDEGRTPLFFALVEQNRPEEAAKVLPLSTATDPLLWLGGSLAFQLAGKTNGARQWREPAIKVFRTGSEDSMRAADLLEGKLAPTPEVVDELILPAPLKALVLANLASTHPEQRDALSAAARRLNVERAFPYHLVQRAIASAR
jgi:thioredoxin-like negative regulator of GroEL